MNLENNPALKKQIEELAEHSGISFDEAVKKLTKVLTTFEEENGLETTKIMSRKWFEFWKSYYWVKFFNQLKS